MTENENTSGWSQLKVATKKVKEYWNRLSERERLIVKLITVSVIIALFIRNILNGMDVIFWGGIVLYGIITYSFGYQDSITENSETKIIRGHPVDGVLWDQVILVLYSIFIFVIGEIVYDYLTGSFSITKFQMIGVIVGVSRAGLRITRLENDPSGRWKTAIWGFSLSAFIAPYPISYLQKQAGNNGLGGVIGFMEILIPIVITGIMILDAENKINILE
jgi:hypothetical protein